MENNEKGRSKFEIIVMTKPEQFEIHENEVLRKVCEDAQSRAGFSRDLSKWELKDSNGVVISFDETEGKAGIHAGTQLYLTQKIGAGGN